jgi:4,5-DOPA dioxygenase extradiol
MLRLPTVFVSHGSPMLALESGATGQAWRALGSTLARPRAIVALSAHWSAPITTIGSGARHDTIHDFYGFPAALYQLRYDSPGDPTLAQQLSNALEQAGWPVRLDAQRGLDHGAWVPLRAMYPEADIPVVPVSINAHRDPSYHYRLGQVLRPALPDDVLLLASGSLTHNLQEFEPGRGHEPAAGYVQEFQDWMHRHLQAGDLASLLDYRRQAPAAARAHPSDEHLLPLYAALGAAEPPLRATRHLDIVTERILAMDIYSFVSG